MSNLVKVKSVCTPADVTFVIVYVMFAFHDVLQNSDLELLN